MKTYLAAASSLALTLSLAGAVMASEHESQTKQPQAGAQTMSQSSTTSAGAGMAAKAQSGESAQMTTKTAEEMDGMAVVNSAGEKIGEVEKIVREKDGDKLSAVVSVGGFLGIGDKEVDIPLEDLSLSGDQVVAPLASTKEELESRTAYKEDMYEEVPDEQAISLSDTGSSIESEPADGGKSQPGAMSGEKSRRTIRKKPAPRRSDSITHEKSAPARLCRIGAERGSTTLWILSKTLVGRKLRTARKKENRPNAIVSLTY